MTVSGHQTHDPEYYNYININPQWSNVGFPRPKNQTSLLYDACQTNKYVSYLLAKTLAMASHLGGSQKDKQQFINLLSTSVQMELWTGPDCSTLSS